MFNQITIIGFGLIGSSIAKGVRAQGLARRVVCADRSRAVCDTVERLNLADAATTSLIKGVEGSDLVILCVPVGAMGEIAMRIGPHLQDGALISDVGSVKSAVIRDVTPHLPDHALFVPAHPLAGTEHSGPESGFAELFHGRWSVITPESHTPLRAIEKLTAFWEALGSRVEILDAAHHDLILGITSHLPHLIAYTIVGTAADLEDDLKGEVIKFSATGFRDFTRIASSDPTMWRDVFLNNKDAVLEILQRFTEDLTAMQRAIRKQDGDYLYNRFDTGRGIRKAIIDAGQA